MLRGRADPPAIDPRSGPIDSPRPGNRAWVGFNYPDTVTNLMAARKAGVALVEASTNRIVIDTKVGRIIVEPETVRFHRSGRGRGRVLLGPESAS